MTAKRTLVFVLVAFAVLQFLHGLAPAPANQPEEGAWTGLLGGAGFLAATLVAADAVRRDKPAGCTFAFALGLAIPVGFLLYHGAWFTSPVTNPYWGDGTASGWQWASVIAVSVTGLVVAALSRAPQRARDLESVAA